MTARFFLPMFTLPLFVAVGHAQPPIGDLPLIETIESLNLAQARAYAEKGITNWNLKRAKTITDEAFEFVVLREGDVDFGGLTEVTESQLAYIGKKFRTYHFDGIKVMTDELAERLGKIPHPFSLNGLEIVSDRQLEKILSKLKQPIYLGGLHSLTPSQARIVAASSAHFISLSGITSFPDDIFEILFANPKSSYSFYGLKKLSEKQCRLIARNERPIYISGVKSISNNCFKILMDGNCFLWLSGLTHLSPAQELAFAQSKNAHNLGGLVSLSPVVARKLVKADPVYLYINQISNMSPETAKEVGRFQGQILTVHQSAGLTPALARELSQAQSSLSFPDLKVLTPEIAKELAGHLGTLGLDGLEQLPPASAGAFANHVGMLELGALTTISDAAAKSLSQHHGGIYFKNLQSLSNVQFRELVKTKPLFVDHDQPFGRLKKAFTESQMRFVQDLASYRSTLQPVMLDLGGLKSLPDLGREPLPKMDLPIRFSDLVDLTEEQARILGQAKEHFRFGQFSTLTDAQARLFSQFQGGIELENVVQITERQAMELATFRGQQLHLKGSMNLSDDIKELLGKNHRIRIEDRSEKKQK